MAFATFSNPINVNIFQSLNRARVELMQSRARRRAYVQTKRALSALDGTTLADLGLTRSQIDSVSRETARSVN